MIFILFIFVIVALVGSLPIWKHNKHWGYYPIAGVSTVILLVLVLLFVFHSGGN